MDLNRLGTGKKLVEKIIKQNNVGTMGWLQEQQKKKLDTQKNPYPPNMRKK